ncbi:MAG TPA: hypothetical protein VGQ83_10280, partial [Polyangia bacterium]
PRPAVPAAPAAPRARGSRFDDAGGAAPAPAARPAAPAAAAAPAAVRPAPAPGELGVRWGELVNRIEAEDPPLWGVVAGARPVAWTPAGLTIAFNTEAEASYARSSADRLQRLSGAAAVTIAVGAAAQAPLSIAQSEEQHRREERDQRRREAREHPAYRDTMEVFKGATEKDIKTDVD